MKTSQKSLINFKEIITNMKQYPTSFLMYVFPALLIVYLATFLIDFLNNLDLAETQLTVNGIITLFSLVFIYFLTDSFVSHFVYSQYNLKKSFFKMFIPSILTFHIYILQRLILFGLIFSPYIVLIVLLQFISFIQAFLSSQVVLIILVLILLILFMCSFLFSFYLALSYSYLPVSVHFSKTKSILKFKEYKKVVHNKRKSIIVRMLILFGILLVFQLGYYAYDFLISFIPQDQVSLIFQGIGLLIAMLISYFSNSYLFFTYKKLIHKN